MKKIFSQKQFGEALSCLDEKLISDYLKQKQKSVYRKKSMQLFKNLTAAVACIALIAAGVLLLPRLGMFPSDASTENCLSNAGCVSESIDEHSREYRSMPPSAEDAKTVKTNIPTYVYCSEASSAQNAPPAFGFETSNFVIRAKVTEIYDDTYSVFSGYADISPQSYRVVKMQTLESVRGENMPQYFIYLLPEYLYTDLTEYDCLLLSLYQKGTSEFVIVNKTSGTAQCLGMPVFASSNTEYGNVIAFKDGIFDESLWQTTSWAAGYQFAKRHLDSDDGFLFVSRGDDCETVVERIKNELAIYSCADPECIVSLSFDTKEASDALSYVSLSNKNVFLQIFSTGSNCVRYVRYICGCITDESVTIEFETGNVVYSQSRYSYDDIISLPDISSDICKMKEEYQLDIPSPPHMKTDGKRLLQLYLSGMYVKNGGRTYGLMTTSWLYMQADDYSIRYTDKEFILYDITNDLAYSVTADEAADILGLDISDAQYGKPVEIPIC